MENHIVIIKGAGDIASGIAHKLHRSGFKVIMTEIANPTCVRRNVSFAVAVYEDTWEIEGVIGKRANNAQEVQEILEDDKIAVIVDPPCNIREAIHCTVLVDAILAKYNTGTCKEDAPVVIGLGPGFVAGKDVDLLVETNRGHDLGRIIFEGEAEPNTGIPGNIAGYGIERVLRAPISGKIRNVKKIGDRVETGEIIAMIGETEVKSSIAGVIRGLIYDGLEVREGFKIGDVDPRKEAIGWDNTISDKARCIAGGVLEAILMKLNEKDKEINK